MKKILLVVLLLIISTSGYAKDLGLTEDEKSFLRSHRVIRTHNSQGGVPFNFNRNGLAQGYTVDYLELLASKLNIEFKFISGHTWVEFMDMLAHHEIDMMSNISQTPARDKFALFTIPIIKYAPAIISKTDAQFPNMESLSGHTLALVEGYWYNDLIKMNYPDIKILLQDYNIDTINAVSFGRADATIGNGAVLQYLWLEKNITNVSISGEAFPLDNDLFFERIGVRNDWPLLRSALNKAIESITYKEELQLKHKWLDPVTNNRISRLKLSPEEIEYLVAKGVIRMCVDPNFLPYEGIDDDGEHEGIAADFIDLFRNQLPVPIKLIPTKSWKDSLEMVQRNECDILPLLNSTPERSEYLNFTEPYVNDAIVIVAKNDVVYLDGIQALAGKTISVAHGYYVGDVVNRKYPEIDIIYAKSEDQALRAVSDGKAYATLTSILTATRGIQRLGLTDLKIAGQTSLSNEFRIGINKNEPILLGIFEKAVNSIDQQTTNQILRHWYTVGFQNITDWRVVWKVSSVALISLVLLIINIISNRKFNRKMTQANIVLQSKNNELNDLKIQLEKNVNQLNKLAITDKLTGLFNRVKIDATLNDEFNRAKRFHNPFGIILLDIDHFKNINDTYGHQVGDSVLVELALLLEKHTRETDVIGRWGGEEFMIICPQASIFGILKLANYLRERIEDNEFSAVISLTASFGVTMSRIERNDSITKIISRADKALYDAKNAGRNIVKDR